MRRISYLPNLLSSLRITLSLAMLGAAYANAKEGFAALLTFQIATDALDGVLARRWKAVSPLGARLDHWGDALTAAFGGTGVFFLWPQAIEREWPWALAVVIGYMLVVIERLVEPRPLAHPAWWRKPAGGLVPLSLFPLLRQISPLPFRMAALLYLVIGAVRLVAAVRRRPGRTGGAGPETRATGRPEAVAT